MSSNTLIVTSMRMLTIIDDNCTHARGDSKKKQEEEYRGFAEVGAWDFKHSPRSSSFSTRRKALGSIKQIRCSVTQEEV